MPAEHTDPTVSYFIGSAKRVRLQRRDIHIDVPSDDHDDDDDCGGGAATATPERSRRKPAKNALPTMLQRIFDEADESTIGVDDISMREIPGTAGDRDALAAILIEAILEGVDEQFPAGVRDKVAAVLRQEIA